MCGFQGLGLLGSAGAEQYAQAGLVVDCFTGNIKLTIGKTLGQLEGAGNQSHQIRGCGVRVAGDELEFTGSVATG